MRFIPILVLTLVGPLLAAASVQWTPVTPENNSNVLQAGYYLNATVTADGLRAVNFSYDNWTAPLVDDSLMLALSFDNASLAPNASWLFDGSRFNHPVWITSGYPNYSAGVFGDSFSFNRNTSDVVLVPNHPAVDFQPSESMTLSVWLRFPPGAENPMWSLGKGNAWCETGWGLAHWSNEPTITVEFMLHSNASESCGLWEVYITSIGRGEWHHFAFVLDRQEQVLHGYHDGQHIDSRSISGLGPINNSNDLVLGTMMGSAYVGWMDEFRLYNRSLSAEEIKGLYYATVRKINPKQFQVEARPTSVTPGLHNASIAVTDSAGTARTGVHVVNASSAASSFVVNSLANASLASESYRFQALAGASPVSNVWWAYDGASLALNEPSLVASYSFDRLGRLDEYNGTFKDASRYGRHLLWGSSNLTGSPFGTAAYFDQLASQYYQTEFVDLLTDSNDTTVSVWVKPGSGQVNYATILDWSHFTNGNGDKNWVVQQNVDQVNKYYFAYHDESDWRGMINVDLYARPDQWSHLVFVKTGTNLTAFLNGRQVDSMTSALNMQRFAAPLYVGRNGDTSRSFNGSIDEVRIYNRSLSASEVASLYRVNARKIDPYTYLLDVLYRDPTPGLHSSQANATNGGFSSATDLRFINVTNPGIAYVSPSPRNNSAIAPNTTLRVEIAGSNVSQINLTLDNETYSIFDKTLLLHMSFDTSEAYGENASRIIDSSRYAAHGNRSGPVSTPGFSGNGLSFDGVNDDVRIVSQSNLSTIQLLNSLTASLWVYPNDNAPNGGQYIMAKHHPFLIEHTSTNLRWGIFTETGWFYWEMVAPALTPGRWTHVTMTMDNATHTTRMYFNGVQVGSYTGLNNTSPNSDWDLTLGHNYFSTVDANHFNGTLDEVYLYNRSLTPQEVAVLARTTLRETSPGRFVLEHNLTNLGPGPHSAAVSVLTETGASALTNRSWTVANLSASFSTGTPANGSLVSSYFPVNVSVTGEPISWSYTFDGASYSVYDESLVALYNFDNVSELGENGTWVKDASPRGHDLTLSSVHSFVDSPRGKALSMDESGYANAVESDDFDLGLSGSTLCAWFKTSDSEADLIGQWMAAENGELLLMEFMGRVRAHVGYSGSVNVIDSTRSGLNDNQWHYGCQTVNQTHLSVFVDGVRDGQVALVGAREGGTSRLFIGSRQAAYPSGRLNGQLDEVRIHNRPLTDAEIAFLYQSRVRRVNQSTYWLEVNASNPAGVKTASSTVVLTGGTRSTGERRFTAAPSGLLFYAPFEGLYREYVRHQDGYALGAGRSFQSGAFGSALQVLDVGDASGVNWTPDVYLNASAGTISLWVRHATGDGTAFDALTFDRCPLGCEFIIMRQGGGSDYSFGIKNSEYGVLDAEKWNFISGAVTWTSGSWHHVVATWDQAASSKRLYLDGVLVNSSSSPFGFNGSSLAGILAVGAYFRDLQGSPMGTEFKSSLDELMIFNRAFSSDEVLALTQRVIVPRAWFAAPTLNNASLIGTYARVAAEADAGRLARAEVVWNDTAYPVYDESLLHSYSFDNRSALGDNATRVTDAGRFPADLNQFVTQTGGVPVLGEGKFGTAMSFNGWNGVRVNETLSGVTGENYLSGFTVGAWVKTVSTNSWQCIVIKHHPFMLLLGGTRQLRGGVYTTSDWQWVDGPVFPVDEWHHVMATYNASTDRMSLYLDGENVSTVDGVPGTPQVEMSDTLTIGQNHWGSTTDCFFVGSIDEVRVYNRSLSAPEARAVYQHTVRRVNATTWRVDSEVSNLLPGWHSAKTSFSDAYGSANTGTRWFGSGVPAVDFIPPTPIEGAVTGTTVALNASMTVSNLTHVEYTFDGQAARLYDPSLTYAADFDAQTGLGENATHVADLSMYRRLVGQWVSGPFTFVPGKHGSAIQLATSDWYGFPASPFLSNDDFTIAAWVKSTSTEGQNYFLLNTYDGDGYRYGLGDGKIAFLIGNSTEYIEPQCGSTVVTDGNWHHVASVFDRGTSVRCYVDGVFTDSVALRSFPGMRDTPPALNGLAPSLAFPGSLDGLRVFNRTLSDAEVLGLYRANVRATDWDSWLVEVEQVNLTPGRHEAVVYAARGSVGSSDVRSFCAGSSCTPTWTSASDSTAPGAYLAPMDVSVNTSLHGYGVRSLNATVGATPLSLLDSGLMAAYSFDRRVALGENSTHHADASSYGRSLSGYVASFVDGPSGTAPTFSGNTAESFTSNPVDLLGESNDTTISLWVKPGATQGDYADILDWDHSSTQQNWVIQQDASSTNRFYFSFHDENNWQGNPLTTQLTAGQWQQLTIVKSGTNLTHYLNGVPTGSLTVPLNLMRMVRPLTVGRNIGPIRPFNGAIDEVRIYNRALTPEQVALLYRVSAVKEAPDIWRVRYTLTDAAVGSYALSLSASDAGGTPSSTTYAYHAVGQGCQAGNPPVPDCSLSVRIQTPSPWAVVSAGTNVTLAYNVTVLGLPGVSDACVNLTHDGLLQASGLDANGSRVITLSQQGVSTLRVHAWRNGCQPATGEVSLYVGRPTATTNVPDVPVSWAGLLALLAAAAYARARRSG